MAKKETSVYGEMAEIFYGNVNPRRKQEDADARMISEDHNAMANLSPTVINEEFNPDRFVEHLNMFNQSDRKYKTPKPPF